MSLLHGNGLLFIIRPYEILQGQLTVFPESSQLGSHPLAESSISKGEAGVNTPGLTKFKISSGKTGFMQDLNSFKMVFICELA